MPLDPMLSEDDSMDDDDADADFEPYPHNEDTPSDQPPSKKRCLRQVFEEVDSEDEVEEQEEVDDPNEVEDPQPQGQANSKGKGKGQVKRKGKSALQTRPTKWKKVDITNPSLPEYQHVPPLYIQSPQEYFYKFFSPQLIKHITYQTNLYATQKDIATSFTTTDEEITILGAFFLIFRHFINFSGGCLPIIKKFI